MWWMIVLAGVSIDAGAVVGYDGNVYQTPSGQYTDPETQTVTTNDPTSAVVLMPELDVDLAVGEKFRFEVRERYDGDLYFGSGNVANANGMLNVADAWVAFDPVHRAGSVRYLTVEAGVTTRARTYNYLNRGTGTLRNTLVTGTEEGDRYRYTHLGGFAETSLRLQSRTRVSVRGGYGRRNYPEIGTLESFDQNVGTFEVSASQWAGDFRFSGSFELDNRDYVARRAVDATGALVTGTSRVYRYNAYRGGVSWRNDIIRVGASYRFRQKNDIYADYWSFDEHRIYSDFDLDIVDRYFFELDADFFSRNYAIETAPNGQVRTRNGIRFSVSAETFVHELVAVRAGFSYRSDDDTDPYYTYSDTLFFAGAAFVY